MTTVSDTDIQVFSQLVNPQKANVNKISHSEEIRSTIMEENDSDDEQMRGKEASVVSRQPIFVPSPKASPRLAESDDSDDESKHSVKSSVKSVKNSETSSVQSDDDAVAQSHVSHFSQRSSHTNRSSTMKQEPVSAFDTFLNNRKPNTNLPPLASGAMNADLEILEKQQILMDMERLKMQGIKLTKEWTIADRIDDMQFEVRRHMLHIDEVNNINMMRDGMRLMCSGFEMMNTRLGFLELDGWSAEVCADMDKYDNALGRIYRKYWRTSTQNSAEMEIVIGLIGSMGMFHFKQKMQSKLFEKNKRPVYTKPPPAPKPAIPGSDSDSDESVPP